MALDLITCVEIVQVRLKHLFGVHIGIVWFLLSLPDLAGAATIEASFEQLQER